jgi:hypothetical protein
MPKSVKSKEPTPKKGKADKDPSVRPSKPKGRRPRKEAT